MRRFLKIRTLLLAAVISGASIIGANSAHASCHSVTTCHWQSVVEYKTVAKPYVYWVTKYTDCGKPYQVQVVKYTYVSVPVERRIRVCY